MFPKCPALLTEIVMAFQNKRAEAVERAEHNKVFKNFKV
jgi:hypothetical protein